jgi:hypothetical protein
MATTTVTFEGREFPARNLDNGLYEVRYTFNGPKGWEGGYIRGRGLDRLLVLLGYQRAAAGAELNPVEFG